MVFYTDNPLEFSSIRRGQIFVEEECGSWVKCIALEDAKLIDESNFRNGWTFDAKVISASVGFANSMKEPNPIINYFQDAKITRYGPFLRAAEHTFKDGESPLKD